MHYSYENGCQDESGDNISDSGSTSDDDSVIFMITKNPSLNPSASEFVPSQSGSPDFTQNNITRDHLLDVRGPEDVFDSKSPYRSGGLLFRTTGSLSTLISCSEPLGICVWLEACSSARSQSGSPDFTQNNITRDHLLDVRGPDDAFDIDNSFQSEFETRCADSSIEVSQSELRSDAERSLDYEVAF
jgi:hypothetical protein